MRTNNIFSQEDIVQWSSLASSGITSSFLKIMSFFWNAHSWKNSILINNQSSLNYQGNIYCHFNKAASWAYLFPWHSLNQTGGCLPKNIIGSSRMWALVPGSYNATPAKKWRVPGLQQHECITGHMFPPKENVTRLDDDGACHLLAHFITSWMTPSSGNATWNGL